MDIDRFAQTDAGMVLALGSVAYSFIIFLRMMRVAAARSGFDLGSRTTPVLAAFMVLIMFAWGNGIGWAMAIFDLVAMTSIVAMYTILTGGMAAGSLIRSGSARAVSAVLLIAASISLGFVEPLISAPVCTAALGLNIYLEYSDTYGVLNRSLWNNPTAHYVLVYPPLVLLFVLTDILAIGPVVGQVLMSVIVTGLSLIGIVAGYRGNSFHY